MDWLQGGRGMIRAEQLDGVTVNYTGTLEDGTVFDRSPEDRPLRFILGREEVIPGFDAAVQGLFQGESKTFVIPCEDAYGAHREDLVETIDRSQLPADVELKAGIQLEVTREDDSVLSVMVTEVTKDTVTLDANHPLAGKPLTFEIELLEVVKDPPEAKMMDMFSGMTPPMTPPM
jgi:peptidylprolyl isomerase